MKMCFILEKSVTSCHHLAWSNELQIEFHGHMLIINVDAYSSSS